jgi:hypothetical protein
LILIGRHLAASSDASLMNKTSGRAMMQKICGGQFANIFHLRNFSILISIAIVLVKMKSEMNGCE